MDQDHPEWLTVDFLNQCIRSKERFREMTTASFTAESAVPPGNNYGSYILRVIAKLQDQADAGKSEESLSLIVKCPLTSGTIKELFGEVLLRTTSFTAESAVPLGNNYGSEILRVKVTLQDQAENGWGEHSLSLIIKSPLTSGVIKELFEKVFESEPIFYNEFLPLGRQLLNRSFTAEYFQSPMSAVVVLEDLKEEGFVMAEKLKQLDFEHCRLYMTAAANFHAMSVAVYKQDRNFIKRIDKEKLFSNDLDQVTITSSTNMMKYCLESFANHVSEFLEDDRISRIIMNCSPIFWDLMVEAVKPNETFNTLNQGDPWLTNMMFMRDEDGKAYDIKLLDFQCLRYASPITDLMFFIWTSANYNVLQNSQNALFEIYLESLNDALDEMEIKEKLSMKTLKEHVTQMSPIALYAIAICRPMIMKSSFTDMGMIYTKCKEEYSPNQNPYDVLYTESFCKNHLPPLVEYLDKSGVFDHIESILEKGNC